VALIPHTLAATVCGEYAPGRAVHLEVDLIARYLARLLEDADSIGRTR
jgi:riboflavin synthase